MARTSQKYLANNLVYLRKKAGLSQDEFVAQLGIKRSTYSAHEIGKTEPFIDALIMLANYHCLTVDALLRINLAGLTEYDLYELKEKSWFYLQSLTHNIKQHERATARSAQINEIPA